MSDSETAVVDMANAHRYELQIHGNTVGFADYVLHDRVVTISHVETAPEHRGNGYADLLMAGIIDDARARNLTIRPLCSFAASHMNADPSAHDLIAS